MGLLGNILMLPGAVIGVIEDTIEDSLKHIR